MIEKLAGCNGTAWSPPSRPCTSNEVFCRGSSRTITANVPSASQGVGSLCHSPSRTSDPDLLDRVCLLEQPADHVRREVRRHRRVLQPDLRPRRRRRLGAPGGRRGRRSPRRAPRPARPASSDRAPRRSARRAARGRARAATASPSGRRPARRARAAPSLEAVRGEQAQADVERAIDQRRDTASSPSAVEIRSTSTTLSVDIETGGARVEPRAARVSSIFASSAASWSLRSAPACCGLARDRARRRRPRARRAPAR